MNGPRMIRCVVIELPADTITRPDPRFRPSQLLPWSDPQIAQLVTKLQDEVRTEREPRVPRSLAERNELEMPWNEPFEYESTGDDQEDFSIDVSGLEGK